MQIVHLNFRVADMIFIAYTNSKLHISYKQIRY